MKRKALVVLVAILVLIMATGCKQEPTTVEPDVTTVPIEEMTPSSSAAEVRPGVTILADGVVQAAQPTIPLAFETNGKLLVVHVQVGDLVEAGDLIATLDDTALQEAVNQAALQVRQAENNLAQLTIQTDSEFLDRSVVMAELDVAQAEGSLVASRGSLDRLLNWSPKEDQVALAEANLAAAKAALENAQTSDAVAGNSLTAASIAVDQAERQLADAQKAYDTAFDPARDWEQYVDEPICYQGQGGAVPCTGPWHSTRIEEERKYAPLQLQAAEENLQIAQAQYSLAFAGVNDDMAVSAYASVVSAEQALADLLAGPTEEQIESAQQTVEQAELTLDRARINLETAQLRVEQARLSLEQSQINLQQAENALARAQLTAPSSGTVLTVEVAAGTMVGAGTPIVTLMDTDRLEFHTTNLSERDLAQIHLGQVGVVVLKAYPDDPIEATVVRIGLLAGPPVGDAATFPVILDLSQSELDIRPGMTGRAEIRSQE